MPNSTVYLLRNVNQPRDYSHTHLFAYNIPDKVLVQANYYMGFLAPNGAFAPNSYIRVNNNTLRLQGHADNYRDVDYMMFTTGHDPHKWYYAFVNQIRYVNDSVFEVEYEIDYLQTYWYDIDFDNSMAFIEREHSLNDRLNENLVPEDVGTDNYKIIQSETVNFNERNPTLRRLITYYVPKTKVITGLNYEEPNWIVQSSPVTDANKIVIINGTFQGCAYYITSYDVSTTEYQDQAKRKLSAIIDFLTDDNATIVNMQILPDDIASFYEATQDFNVVYSHLTTLICPKELDGGYIPANKKLYTFPYTKARVNNNNGSYQDYRFEWSDFLPTAELQNLTIDFKCCVAPTCEISAVPKDYNNLDLDYSSAITLNNFPNPSWSLDSFNRWFAQNNTAVYTNFGIAIVSAALAALTAPLAPAAAVIGAGVAFASQSMHINTQAKQPNSMQGTSSNMGLNAGLGRVGFDLQVLSQPHDTLVSIDRYFTRYGYAVKRFTKPAVFSNEYIQLRPHWNFIKTADAKFKYNNVPLQACEAINQAFDRGITFWVTTIGNYNQSNDPPSV